MKIVIVMFVAVCTLVFEAAIYGEEIAEQSFPETRNVDFGECKLDQGDGFFQDLFDGEPGDGPFAVMTCYIGTFLVGVGNFFTQIYGAGLFFWNMVSFNIPGTPTPVRIVVSVAIGAPIVWGVMTSLFRGSSAN